jgi:glutamate--cysteine ligase
LSQLAERLRALAPGALAGLRRGIEKESLRVLADGALALTPHPAGLGSALTHPHVTTDFSESQLELITGVHAQPEACFEELTQLHQVVYRNIDDEVLWCASMPCGLSADEAIPIAQYGSSNLARAKTVYRIGLSHRYGRRMQAISGIHYNFSMPGLSNDAYFALIRNFRRHSWLLLYLYGASPSVCESFVRGREHQLQELTPGTLYMPHATSLRMGRLGYQSEAQAQLAVSYNSLESYGATLQQALTRPYPPYEAIGLRDGEGEGAGYRQLATSLLQIEAEFYGTIRPKRVLRAGERALHALRQRGVEYLEVRLMDLNPFCAVGIAVDTLRFLDVFLLHCHLCDSPADTPEELQAMAQNILRAAVRGREPGLPLARGPQEVALGEWGGQVLAECEPIAAALDRANGGSGYSAALSGAVAALKDPASTPSARVLEAMLRDHEGTYARFVLAQSLQHRDTLRSMPLSEEVAGRFARLAQESLADQRRIEAADTAAFETYRQRYLSAAQLG